MHSDDDKKAYEVVTAHDHVVSLGDLEDLVALRVRVGILGWFSRALECDVISGANVSESLSSRTHFMLLAAVRAPNIPPSRMAT